LNSQKAGKNQFAGSYAFNWNHTVHIHCSSHPPQGRKEIRGAMTCTNFGSPQRRPSIGIHSRHTWLPCLMAPAPLPCAQARIQLGPKAPIRGCQVVGGANYKRKMTFRGKIFFGPSRPKSDFGGGGAMKGAITTIAISASTVPPPSCPPPDMTPPALYDPKGVQDSEGGGQIRRG